MKQFVLFFVGIITFFNSQASVDPWYKDKSEWTKLMHAVYKNKHDEIVKILHQDTLTINVKTSRGLTAMIIAIRKNNLKIVELLFNNKHYVQLNNINLYNSEIREACIYSNRKIIYFILQKNIKIINSPIRKDTLIYIPHVICHRSLRVLKFFNSNGLDWNSQRNSRYPTLLYCVASRGKIRKTKYLLQNGADKNIKNNKGETIIEVVENAYISKRKKAKLKKLLE